ncbi:MAG: S1C family serine protease [Planctomycetes bacterium]|nr:S1C family serine protease [Planctomycetota bacterium]
MLPGVLASAQVLERLEQEFIEIASTSKSCCVKIELMRIIDESALPAPRDGKERAPRQMEVQTALSGILLDEAGHVATLGEALDGVTRAWISRYTDQEEVARYKADVIGFSIDSNVGLLRIRDASALTTLPLGDSDAVKQGSIVFGLGFTYNMGQAPSFSVGMVNATDLTFRFNNNEESKAARLIQTSLPLNPGEVGGPVINASGEIVGLMLTTYAPGNTPLKLRRVLGELIPSRNVTLVLPINRIKKEVEWILAKQKEGPVLSFEDGKSPWLGLTASDISDHALRKQLQIPEGGVLVQYIFPDDPAEQAGITVNDVLMQWNGVSIKSIDHLKSLVGTTQDGDQIGVVLIRAGQELKVELHIGKE